jgi:hypothetical protein
MLANNMISTNIWGPPTWILLHSIVEQIKNPDFNNYKVNILNIIKNICINVPCQVSSQTSRFFLNNVNINTLQNLHDIKVMLYLFHNFVNKNNKKAIFNFSDTKKYKDVNLSLAFGLFRNLHLNNLNLKNSMNHNKMVIIINDINNFILENIVYYDKIQIKKEIEEVVQVEEVINVEEAVVKEEVVKEEVVKEEVVKEEVVKDCKPKISMIEDCNLPSFDLTLPEAMIEMMKNPKCLPYKVYVERWTFLKKKQDKKKKLTLKDLPLVNDELLPPIDLTLPIAMAKIKDNKKCVPFDLYVKRWNELKTLSKHKKRFS